MSKIFGIIPVRMASSRFPGKPLKKILSITLLRHVYERCLFFKNWSHLSLAICDSEVASYAKKNNIPFIWTSKRHQRCLDRVAEAANKIKKKFNIKKGDLIIGIQGDEPLLRPNMIERLIKFHKKFDVNSTVLCMQIIHKKQYLDDNVVKVVHDHNNKVLYQSRRPIPYVKKFNKSINAKRIYGIFGFKFSYLNQFTKKMKASYLEKLESCDTNRICSNDTNHYVVDYKFYNSYSVDLRSHIKVVAKYLKNDLFFKKYKSISEK